jgi:chromosome partitioning protein
MYAYAPSEGGSVLIITFANSKGGVGKSTACISIAGAYAKAGMRLHIADLDGNHTVSRWLADDATRPPNITVSEPDPQKLTEDLQKIARDHAPDLCFIDSAGVYETALTFAVGRAHLTIIPVCPSSEADIFEGRKVAKHIDAMRSTFNRPYLYRVLATKVSTLPTFAQGHGFKEIRRLQLPLFATRISQRTAYEEVGYSGRPPHFAEPMRGTTAKAIAELDQLKRELDQLLEIAEPQADLTPELEQIA